MAKQINQNAALYQYISYFYKLWKDNTPLTVAEPFVCMTQALEAVYNDSFSDSKSRRYSRQLIQHIGIALEKYKKLAKDTVAADLAEFVDELTIKSEWSVKNFRAQWVVGWGKYRRNFDAAYTLAAIMAISLHHPRLVEELTAETRYKTGDIAVEPLQNVQEVTAMLLDKLYTLLPENIISHDFRNTVLADENYLFRVLFFGTLYVIASSDTENSLYENNYQYAFRDKFARAVKQTENDHSRQTAADYDRYFTALFNHCRIIRSGKHDRSAEKQVEKTFVAPRLHDDYGQTTIAEGGINVIMGETGLGKSSLLYALSSAALYDRVETDEAAAADFENLRKDLQQLTEIRLKDALPVYIYATDYRKADNVRYPSVNHFAYGAQGYSRSKTDLEKLIFAHNGPVLIMVDAIDEMRQEYRRDFMEYLRQLKITFPDATFIITSRNINLKVFDDLSTEVTCLKMIHSDENIRKIITNYIKIFRKNFTADSFYSGMENNSYLKDMLRNPYQIRKIISFAGDSAAVQPVAVYDRLIRDIVEDKWGDLFVGLDSSAVINVLRVLACTGLGNDGIVIPARRIAETLEECASQAGVYAPVDWTGFADSIAIRSGLLLYDDMKNGFTFMSDNFMYYLAAQWIYLLYTNRYATIDSRLDGTDVPVNSYMLKGILSDCLKKYKTDLKTVTMLFFIADYKEKTTRNSGTDTVQLLMELMVENALLYGDDELKAQLSDLLTKAIPASDMGKLRLKGKKNYHLTEKL